MGIDATNIPRYDYMSREQLLSFQTTVLEELKDLKARLAKARYESTSGKYLPRGKFLGMEKRVSELGVAAVNIQNALSMIKERNKEKNRQDSANFLRCFYKVARELIPDSDFECIEFKAIMMADSDK